MGTLIIRYIHERENSFLHAAPGEEGEGTGVSPPSECQPGLQGPPGKRWAALPPRGSPGTPCGLIATVPCVGCPWVASVGFQGVGSVRARFQSAPPLGGNIGSFANGMPQCQPHCRVGGHSEAPPREGPGWHGGVSNWGIFASVNLVRPRAPTHPPSRFFGLTQRSANPLVNRAKYQRYKDWNFF